MAADNVTLNAGTGGSTLRTLSDGANEWPTGVACYATTVSPGANVLQVVTASFGLPVAQQGSWTVGVSGTAAVTQSGSWAVTTDVTGLVLAQGSTTSGQTGPLAQGACTTAAPSYTSGKTEPLSLDASGNLRVLVTPSGTQAVSGTVAISGSVAVTGTFWQFTQPVSGTFWQATQPISGTVAATQSGTWTNTVTQATAASLNATVVGTGTFAVQAAQSGTWNVGTVTTVTTVSAVTAISNALPAGTNLIGQVAQAPQVAAIYNGTTSVAAQIAEINVSSSAPTTLVAAVSGKKIYVLRWSCTANGNVNVNLQSHATTGNATGPRPMTQYSTAGGAWCPAAIFVTTAGEALDINLSAAVAVGGELTYCQF